MPVETVAGQASPAPEIEAIEGHLVRVHARQDAIDRLGAAARTGSFWARCLAALAALAFVLFALERGLLPLMQEQRQRHLAADLLLPTEAIDRGEALGVLQIPRLGLNQVVVQGDGMAELRSGPAHRMASAVPGQAGNAVLFGHRDRYGGPFNRLDVLAPGDEVLFQLRGAVSGQRWVVANASLREAGDIEPLLPTTTPTLTLVTSDSSWFSTERWVIVATPDGSPPPRLASPTATAAYGPERPSLILNGTAVLLVLLIATAFVGARYLGRSLRRRAVAALVAPPLLLAFVLWYTMLDAVLPATR